MKKVSIIVPVYKIPYDVLKLGIKSIILQSYSNIEIILVDDGSPDSCGEICDTFAQEDQRIKVYHKVNEGVSTARNLGLKKSTGEYILFVDADDYLHPSAVEIMLEIAVSEKSDIVICSYERFFSDVPNIVNITTSLSFKTFESENDLACLREKCLLENRKLGARFNGAPWAKLYKKSLLEEYSLTFDVALLRSQDNYFNFQVFGYVHRVTYINEKLYFYRFLENSAVNKLRKNQFEVSSIYISTIERYLKENNIFDRYSGLYNAICLEKFCEYINIFIFHPDNDLSFEDKCKNIDYAQKKWLSFLTLDLLNTFQISKRIQLMVVLVLKKKYRVLYYYILCMRFLRNIKRKIVLK